PAAGVPEGPVLHHGPDGILCLFIGPGDQHALAQGQTVRLDDDGEGGGFQIGERRSGRIEHLISGGGDVIFFHQVLGKDLAGLDPGGSGVRPEAGDARGVEGVHTPQSQRIVRRHHREPHGVGDGEVHNSADVCGADLRHTNGVSGDAAVARQGVNRLHHRIFFQFFDDGVLPAAAAYYEKIHRIVLLASCIKQCEERPGKTGQAFPVDLPSQIRKGTSLPLSGPRLGRPGGRMPDRPASLQRRSVVEQPHPCKRHHHAVFVGCFNDMVIPDGTAGLNDVLDAGFSRPLHIIAEGEEGVGAACDAGEGCDPGFFLLRRQGIGAHSEGLLPDALRQHVLILVGEIYVDGVIPVRAANILHELQAQHLGMVAEPPGVRLGARQAGAVDAALLARSHADGL
ncbi:Site-specific integrase, partial [Dysosmobacter welbionis]